MSGNEGIKMYKLITNDSNRFKLINENKDAYPLVISIPHSGILITEEMKKSLNKECILANMDWYLPQLYDFLENMGFTVLINNVSRYVIDPNRSLEENTDNSSYNCKAIYTETTFNREMYIKQLVQDEIKNRMDQYYYPYHTKLEEQIEQKLKKYDKVYLIDMHSFGKNIGADIVLGNDYGKTTSIEFFNFIKNELKKEGFSISENKPYRGGYITRHYSEKFKNLETLQIELWYGAYIYNREFGEEYQPQIDGQTFNYAKEKMKRVFKSLVDYYCQ